MNITEKLIKSHLVSGEMIPGKEIEMCIRDRNRLVKTGGKAACY